MQNIKPGILQSASCNLAYEAMTATSSELDWPMHRLQNQKIRRNPACDERIASNLLHISFCMHDLGEQHCYTNSMRYSIHQM